MVSRNDTNTYDADRYIAEIYDQVETQTEDVKLIRRLIAGSERLRILEPFCGSGRILIPLAQDGHELVGLDQSQVMLDNGRAKIDRQAAPYTAASSRAIFWAKRQDGGHV